MKLIVSDLDGTLLRKGEKRLNRNITNIIEKITEKNVFAVASGRAYTELRKLFEGMEDRIYFIPSDGALAVHKGKTLCECPIDKRFLPECEYTAHGKYIVYVKSKKQMLIRKIREQYGNHVIQIKSADEITENIYKITDFTKTAEIPLRKVYEDADMREYAAECANKGAAVKKLAELLGTAPDDCYVFGDNTNDIEMFAYTKNSYAMMTAKPAVKKCAEHIAESFETEAEKLI